MFKSQKNKVQESYKKICFYVASDNRYFSEGVNEFLSYRCQRNSGPLFEVMSLNSKNTTDRLLFIQKNIYGVGGIDRQTLHVVLADEDFLNLISLSFPAHPRLRLIEEKNCSFDYLQRITEESGQLEALVCRPMAAELLSGLTFREKLVCLYIYLECPPKIIGCILGVGEKAISRYRVSIIKKLGCNGKIEFHQALIKYYRNYHPL